jgi:hypothetical protein
MNKIDDKEVTKNSPEFKQDAKAVLRVFREHVDGDCHPNKVVTKHEHRLPLKKHRINYNQFIEIICSKLSISDNQTKQNISEALYNITGHTYRSLIEKIVELKYSLSHE